MSVELPPLPEPDVSYEAARDDCSERFAHSPDQMRAYARAAVDAALEAAAVKCEQRANMKAYDLIGEARARYEQDQITATRLAAAIRAMRSGVEHI